MSLESNVGFRFGNNMSYSHITASGATGANVSQGHARKVIIQYNQTVAGVTTVSDETSTAGTPLIATITNPTIGQKFEYWTVIDDTIKTIKNRNYAVLCKCKCGKESLVRISALQTGKSKGI